MAGEISPLVASLNVAVGGGVGAVLRYHVGPLAHRLMGSGSAFPWGTLAVNVIGSALMGVLLGWLARGSIPEGLGPESSGESLRLLVGVGLLGGFTTFSAFSAELVTMIHRGQLGLAGGYVAASLVAGVAALYFGLVAAQSLS